MVENGINVSFFFLIVDIFIIVCVLHAGCM